MSDLAARLRKKTEEKTAAIPPRNFPEVYRLRARILGVLIRDARLSSGLTEQNCADELSTSLETFQRWELGQQSPTLPQLEILAYVMGVPVSHFWDTKTITAQQEARHVNADAFEQLRNRVVGTLLRLARQEEKLSQAELAAASGLTADQVATYELGQTPIPFIELTSLASAVRVSLDYFIDDASRIGVWLNQQESFRLFSELPDELREFVSQPSNRAFLELALRLSKMPVNELRDVGASILSITL
jgi:transcriptional regulator with XRE-family HTH domain